MALAKKRSILAFSFHWVVPGCAHCVKQNSQSDNWVETWHRRGLEVWISQGCFKSLFSSPCLRLKTDFSTLNSEGQAQGAWTLELILSDKLLFPVVYGKSFTKNWIQPEISIWLPLIDYPWQYLAIKVALLEKHHILSNKQQNQADISKQWFCAVWKCTVALWKPDQQDLNCLAEVGFLSSTICISKKLFILVKVKVLKGKTL